MLLFLNISVFSLTPSGFVDILTLELKERPPSGMEVIGIYSQEACKKIFDDRDNFRVTYQKDIVQVTNGHEFLLGWDDAKRHDPQKAMILKAFFEDGFETEVKNFFESNIAKLVKEKSLKYSGQRRSIDIVRDITNVVPILWLAERFAIPLKTQEHPKGLLTISEAFTCFLVLFMFQSFNIIPENEWKLRDGALKAAAPLREILEANIISQSGGLKEAAVDWLAKGSAFEVGPLADKFYHALNKSDLSVGDKVANALTT